MLGLLRKDARITPLCLDTLHAGRPDLQQIGVNSSPNAAVTYEHLGFRRIGPMRCGRVLSTSRLSWLARRCMPAEPPVRRARHAAGRGQPCEAGLADWSAPCQAEPTASTIGGINFEGHEPATLPASSSSPPASRLLSAAAGDVVRGHGRYQRYA
jgi:hypothetical protein